MRVTCDGCGAKYAIADERLQGRSVRVKCKKCGASIAVGAVGAPGGAGGALAEPAWTVLLDDGEQRPVTAEQLAELYRQGAVHADTYLWKEGMDDWLPFGEVDEAKRMADAPLEQGVEVTAVPIAETPAAGPAVERARRAIASSPNVDLFGDGPQSSKGASPSPGRVEAGPPRAGSPLSSRGGSALRVGAEGSPLSSRAGSPASSRSEGELSPVSSRAAPLAARSSGVDSSPFSPRAGAGPLSPRPGGDSLFGPASSSPSSRRGGVFDSPPSSQVPGSQGRASKADDRLTASLSGSRNDDSVLFSVANLSGASKNGAEPAKKPSFADVPPAATPSPGVITSDSEASGMIDMRILSTMHGGPPKKEVPRDDRVDDLMNMGGGGGGGLSGPLFGPTLSSPLLAPPSLEAVPPPPTPSVAEAAPASEGTARDAEAPLAVATASTPNPRRSKVPRWAPLAAAGVLGLGVLGVLGLSGVMSGPDKGKAASTATVATAAKADDASRRAQEPTAALGQADAPKADAPKADAPEAAPPAGDAAPSGAAPKTDDAKAEADADAGGKGEVAAARGPKTPEQRKRDEEAAKRRREREEADRKEAADKRAEQEKKAAADSRAKTETASAAAAAAAAAGPAGTGSFDRGAASAALSSAAGGVGGCKKADGPTGLGRVAVTFAPSGAVTNAVVEGPPFAGTPVGGCVAAKFRSAKVPAFAGSAITVKKSFSIN